MSSQGWLVLPTRLELVYNFAELGRWEFVIESEQVTIQRI